MYENFKEAVIIQGKETRCEILNLDTGEIYIGKVTRQEGDKNDWNLAVEMARQKAHIQKCENCIGDVDREIQKLIEKLSDLYEIENKLTSEMEGRKLYLEGMINNEN